jgi:methionyl aminopeptidase
MVMTTRSSTANTSAANTAAGVSVRGARTGLRAPGAAAPALRTESEIESIRAAGMVLRRALDAAAAQCVSGARTRDLDEAARATIETAGAEPLFLHYPEYIRGQGFPANACISVNDAVIHGVPGQQELHDGDLVSIDCGVRLDGWCADAAITVSVGVIQRSHRALLEATRSVLELAIERIRPGVRWSAIASAMEARTAEAGFGVVEEYVGHGIGRKLHESPSAPSVMTRSLEHRGDFTLRPGMVLAVEPMLVMLDEDPDAVLAGGHRASRIDTRKDVDGWTVRTVSGAVSCHLEQTIAVTRFGSDVLTNGNQTPMVARKFGKE